MNGNLERRYRRVLRLLPAYYRDRWEEDMVAAFLDSWLTGDPEADEYISKAAGPSLAEVTSVAGLAARLYLGGASTPRRYFAWGQAVRRAVLVVLLVHAVRGLDALVLTAWSRGLLGRLPAPSATVMISGPGGLWPMVVYSVDYAWIVVYLMLLLGQHRTARILATLVITPGLVYLVQEQLSGTMRDPSVPWAFWILLDFVPVLATIAFHRDAPPTARRPWLLALLGSYFLVGVPLLAVQATGHDAWLPDFPGLCCLLVGLGCLAHVPRAWSHRTADSGAWSLALALLGAVAGVYRIVSLSDFVHDPHLVAVSLAELLILIVAIALVVPDAARAQAAPPAVSPRPDPG